MIEMYYMLVINGKRTIDQVPDKYLEDVRALVLQRSANIGEGGE